MIIQQRVEYVPQDEQNILNLYNYKNILFSYIKLFFKYLRHLHYENVMYIKHNK